jgi:acyl-coenzyme A thioesterase PaaI-like protein
MLPALDRTLRSVPLLETLGVRAEEASTGRVVLRLPHSRHVSNHAGAIHSAALFAVGEVAAAVALGTHPALADLIHLQKSTKIKYYLPSHRDVTAHASVTPEMLKRVQDGLATGRAQVEVSVKVLDGNGRDVAELVSRFAFRRKG